MVNETDTQDEVVRIVLSQTQDIVESIGQGGRWTAQGSKQQAVAISWCHGVRPDVLAQRIMEKPPILPEDLPHELATFGPVPTELLPIESPSVIAVSLAHDLVDLVFRVEAGGVLLQIPRAEIDAFSDATKAWLRQRATPVDPRRIIDGLRSLRDTFPPAALLVFNVSTYDPHDQTRWYTANTHTPSMRASSVNLWLEQHLKELDLTVVDVDRIVAELGGQDAVVSIGRYTHAAHAAMAEEAISMLVDHPVVGGHFASDVMQLNVPRYDRRTNEGVMSGWETSEGAMVEAGQTLFRVRFGDVHSRKSDNNRQSGRAISMQVVAQRAGYVASILRDRGDTVAVGDPVGIVTTGIEINPQGNESHAAFPVAIRIESRSE